MRVAVDTNVLLRAAIRDDAVQARVADKLLRSADLIAITLPCLCEFVWVLRRVYRFTAADSSNALNALLESGNVVVNRPAVEAGLAMLDTGGDFADGVIAHEGRWLGGDLFVSFDKKAVALLTRGGYPARLLR